MTDFLHHLGMEDKELVESLQRGLRSRAVPHGRLMLDSEHLVQRFQALVHEAFTSDLDEAENRAEPSADR